MATNLKILYPDIPFRAGISAVSSELDGNEAQRTILGDRWRLWRAEAADSAFTIDYDLGVGVTASADYFLAALVSRQVAPYSDAVFYLQGGSSSPATNVIGYVQPSVDTMYNPEAEDGIATFATSTAYRYWRVNIESPTVSDFLPYASKFFFGTAFDMGRDPIYGAAWQREYGSRGNRRARYTIDLDYEGITNAVRTSFIDKILKWRDVSPIFLYDAGDLIFHGFKLLHVKITDCRISPRNAHSSDISLSFEEVI